ncbi:MAG: PIN domain-containing protein [Treponema sp.]|jgi:predicted nucleic acid-binding protein|nr:PIN domain-containing protein [Treponema sp.]
MSDKAFIDTNIFVYIQRTDDPQKKLVSEQTTAFFDCVVSTQVLNELCNIFTKKYPVPVDNIQRLLTSIHDNCELITVTEDFVTEALDYHHKFFISYFDALMVVAALKAGSKYLVTEDMQDGLVIDGKLTILNIFNHTDMLIPMQPCLVSAPVLK